MPLKQNNKLIERSHLVKISVESILEKAKKQRGKGTCKENRILISPQELLFLLEKANVKTVYLNQFADGVYTHCVKHEGICFVSISSKALAIKKETENT